MTSAPTARQIHRRPGELAVAVAEQESEAGLLIKRAKEIPGLLGDLGAGGVGGDIGEVDSPCVQPDEEPHLQSLQEHGVHGEVVTGHDPGCLPAHEDRHVVKLVAAPAGSVSYEYERAA
jgi:hypothetical protein